MSDEAVATSPEQQRALEAFYFREARLLDNRQFRQWLALLCEDIRYLVPSRVNVQVDNRQRDQEAMLSVERELEGEDSRGCPIREEGYLQLTLRAERAYKINAWAEQPPARTRRLVGNVELLAQEEASTALSVISTWPIPALAVPMLCIAASAATCYWRRAPGSGCSVGRSFSTMPRSRCRLWGCCFELGSDIVSPALRGTARIVKN